MISQVPYVVVLAFVELLWGKCKLYIFGKFITQYITQFPKLLSVAKHSSNIQLSLLIDHFDAIATHIIQNELYGSCPCMVLG